MVTLEANILGFAETLDDNELTVLREVLHLAGDDGRDVEGFAIGASIPAPADPCEGGEVTFPNAFNMLSNLHVKLQTPRAPGVRFT
jgi:hypothetical protein